MGFYRSVLPLVFALAAGACQTQPPPEFHGRWRPVNRLPEKTQAIPLNPTYVFYATPVDGTLKALLTRWARDSGLQLRYGVSTDFSLHAPVAQLHAVTVDDAVGQLSAIYAGQGIAITTSTGAIAVDPRPAAASN